MEIKKSKPACSPQQRRAKCCSMRWRPRRTYGMRCRCGDMLCARDDEGYARYPVLYAGGCGGWALFAGDDAGAGGDAMCAICMLEAVEGGLCLEEVPEVMRCVLLCMLEAVEGRICLLELLELLEAMRRVLLCMLDAVGVSSICSRCRR